MADFGIVPADMTAASGTAAGAATDVRSADAVDALLTLSGALPGTTTAETVSSLAMSWADGITAWCDRVETYAGDVEGVSATSQAGDQTFGDIVRDLLGIEVP